MTPPDIAEQAAAQSTPERPVIARYTDFRAYLQDMITYLRATRPQFSYRWFARLAGFSSPSFLKLVADGKRNLSADSVDRFARGLGLDAHERGIFETLVQLGQAQTDAARNRYYARLQRAARRDPVVQLHSDQYDAYSRWWPFVIRELVNLPGFDEDPEWIGQAVRPRIRPLVARRALQLLLRLGLVVRAPSGKLATAERTLSTGPEVRNLAVRNFHRGMLTLAVRALDRVPRAERNITSLTIPLTRRKYERVIEVIGELRRTLLELAESEDDGSDSDEARAIYQLTFALVPVTREVSP